MPIIKQLSYHEAQKIAAGEVVERPANIVKELLENALDAGSTEITLHIEDGGKKLIRIIDNGCGMDKEDAQLCFSKHATSKISHVTELESINTFGFRGEALASISAISDVTLITKQNHDTTATQVTIENGIITNIDQSAGTTGTDITIQNLFNTVPARKKFLKSRDTEYRHIIQLVHATALKNPGLHIKFISDGKTTLHCQSTDQAITRAQDIFENTSHQQLIAIDTEKKEQRYTISGIISNHSYGRYDRNQIYFFVNNRWVKNYRLSQALIKAYNNVLPQGKYPLAALALTVPPQELDINIHPRKEEVQFMHPRIVEKLIENTVRKSLETHLSHKIQQPVTLTPAPTPAYMPEPNFTPFTPYNFETISQTSTPQQTIPHPPIIETQQTTTQAHELEHLHIIGQLNKTYILTENNNGLFVIDQHAAHERVLYEQFHSRFDDIATTSLLFPITITLAPAEIKRLTEHFSIFNAMGITMEQFAQDQIIISATPVHAQRVAFDELIKQTLSWLSEHESLPQEQLKKALDNHVHTHMACKAAVKAGDELTQEAMRKLIDDLYHTPNRFSCPHGRPTGWEMSLFDIEKRFKRRV